MLPVLTLAGIGVSRSATPATYHYSLGFTVDSALIGVLIIQLLQMTGSAQWRWLEWEPTRYLGRISYAIYLWHQLAIGLASRLVNGLPAHLVLGSLLSVVVASVSYYIVEKPALRLKARLDTTIRGNRVIAAAAS